MTTAIVYTIRNDGNSVERQIQRMAYAQIGILSLSLSVRVCTDPLHEKNSIICDSIVKPKWLIHDDNMDYKSITSDDDSRSRSYTAIRFVSLYKNIKTPI